MKKKTLCLDLDETLVHSTLNPNTVSDFSIEVNLNGSLVIYHVHIRPYLKEFLEKVSKWYKIVIYTASLREYANLVCDKIDPNNYFSKRLFRESCIPTNFGYFTKDLSIVESDLSQVILLDNSPICFEIHPSNCILIDSFMTNKSDNSLLKLIHLLDGLRFLTDVRSILTMRIDL